MKSKHFDDSSTSTVTVEKECIAYLIPGTLYSTDAPVIEFLLCCGEGDEWIELGNNIKNLISFFSIKSKKRKQEDIETEGGQEKHLNAMLPYFNAYQTSLVRAYPNQILKTTDKQKEILKFIGNKVVLSENSDYWTNPDWLNISYFDKVDESIGLSTSFRTDCNRGYRCAVHSVLAMFASLLTLEIYRNINQLLCVKWENEDVFCKAVLKLLLLYVTPEQMDLNLERELQVDFVRMSDIVTLIVYQSVLNLYQLDEPDLLIDASNVFQCLLGMFRIYYMKLGLDSPFDFEFDMTNKITCSFCKSETNTTDCSQPFYPLPIYRYGDLYSELHEKIAAAVNAESTILFKCSNSKCESLKFEGKDATYVAHVVEKEFRLSGPNYLALLCCGKQHDDSRQDNRIFSISNDIEPIKIYGNNYVFVAVLKHLAEKHYTLDYKDPSKRDQVGYYDKTFSKTIVKSLHYIHNDDCELDWQDNEIENPWGSERKITFQPPEKKEKKGIHNPVIVILKKKT